MSYHQNLPRIFKAVAQRCGYREPVPGGYADGYRYAVALDRNFPTRSYEILLVAGGTFETEVTSRYNIAQEYIEDTIYAAGAGQDRAVAHLLRDFMHRTEQNMVRSINDALEIDMRWEPPRFDEETLGGIARAFEAAGSSAEQAVEALRRVSAIVGAASSPLRPEELSRTPLEVPDTESGVSGTRVIRDLANPAQVTRRRPARMLRG